MKHLFQISCCALLLTTTHLTAQAQGLSWHSLQNEADKSVARHDDKTACKLYQSALQEAQKSGNPSSRLETMIRLGDCKMRLGDSAGAENLFEQSAKLAPSVYGANSTQYSFVLIRLGQNNLKQNKLAEAERNLTAALKIENERPSEGKTALMRTLADLYSKQKKTVEAGHIATRNQEFAPLSNVARQSWVRASSGPGSGNLDFGPYMADLQRRIKKHWFPPKTNESKCVVVTFSVSTDGSLSQLRLDHTCGIALADKAALSAVNDAAPFRPLPAGSPDTVPIEFTFDYNAFNDGSPSAF